MGNPILGADSRLDSDTVTTPAAASGFPATGLSDDRLATLFKPASSATTVDIVTDTGGAAAAVDYFMFSTHNLGTITGVTLTFQGADDVGFTTGVVTPVGGFIPTTDKIIARDFAQVSKRFYRVRMTKGSPFTPTVGQVQWGVAVRPPFGLNWNGFDPQSERVFSRSNRSQNGNILGTVQTFSSRRAQVRLELMPDSFLRDQTSPGGFQDFWDNHASLLKPFLFHWNPGNPGSFEEDAFFGIIEGGGITRTMRTPQDAGFRDLNFAVTGLRE